MTTAEAILYIVLAIIGIPAVTVVLLATNTDIIEVWLANRGKK